MTLENDDYEEINIGGIAVEQLLPEAKERIMEKALLDEDYVKMCKQLSCGRKIDKHFEIQEELLGWKNRLSIPKGLRKRILDSENDSKAAGHFGQERTMELNTRNFFWPQMEMDVRKYCNKCDNCGRTKVPRHAKHGL
jgi:hypothetical protein